MNIDNSILNAFITMMGSVVVLGIILFLVKKFFFKVQNINNDNKIEILSKINLNNKNSIAIIKVQNRNFLVGLTERNISLLTELENKEIHNKSNINLTQNVKNNQINNIKNIKKEDLSFKAFLTSAFMKNN